MLARCPPGAIFLHLLSKYCPTSGSGVQPERAPKPGKLAASFLRAGSDGFSWQHVADRGSPPGRLLALMPLDGHADRWIAVVRADRTGPKKELWIYLLDRASWAWVLIGQGPSPEALPVTLEVGAEAPWELDKRLRPVQLKVQHNKGQNALRIAFILSDHCLLVLQVPEGRARSARLTHQNRLIQLAPGWGESLVAVTSDHGCFVAFAPRRFFGGTRVLG